MKTHSSSAERKRDRRGDEVSASSGFTLVELLVVLAILGLLAAVAVPRVLHYLSGAKTSTAQLQVQAISTALDLFQLDMGRYPTQEEGLKALVIQPPNLERWGGPYVKKQSNLVDPWGFDYHYKIPGDHGEIDVFSLGSDNAVGGTGEKQDVTNW